MSFNDRHRRRVSNQITTTANRPDRVNIVWPPITKYVEQGPFTAFQAPLTPPSPLLPLIQFNSL